MGNALLLPGNERELVDNYLDRTLFPELAEKYDCLKDGNSDTSEAIQSAPMPDLCADLEEYDTMERWWLDLTLEQKLDITGAYEGLFNDPVCDMTKSDEELDSEADKGWDGLSIDDKNFIYGRLKTR